MIFPWLNNLTVIVIYLPLILIWCTLSGFNLVKRRYGAATFWIALALQAFRIGAIRWGTEGGELPMSSLQLSLQITGSNEILFAVAIVNVVGTIWYFFDLKGLGYFKPIKKNKPENK